MRLIDAGKFLNSLTETFTPDDTVDSVKKKVLDTLNTMPEAYDVDKVIEQLEEIRHNAFQIGTLTVAGVMTKAIDIVRKGGVNE